MVFPIHPAKETGLRHQWTKQVRQMILHDLSLPTFPNPVLPVEDMGTAAAVVGFLDLG
jgi:hypothetical protein